MLENVALLRQAVRATSDRLVALLSSVGRPSLRAVGDWTINDLAIHLTDTFERYPGYLRGEAPLMDDPLDVTRHNQEVVSSGQGLSIAEATRRISATIDEIDSLLATRSANHPVPWHGGTELSPSAFAALIGSEGIVHGFDIAAAEDRYIPCDVGVAGLVMANSLHLLPLYLDQGTARGMTASFDVRFKGGERRFLTLDDGRLLVQQAGSRADCVVWGDPETFLLVGYNRIGQWRPALTGKILTWGRKPWLALKLPRLLAQV